MSARDLIEMAAPAQAIVLFAALIAGRDAEAGLSPAVEDTREAPDVIGIVSEENRGDRAVVTIRATMQGEKDDARFSLVRVRGPWRLEP